MIFRDLYSREVKDNPPCFTLLFPRSDILSRQMGPRESMFLVFEENEKISIESLTQARPDFMFRL